MQRKDKFTYMILVGVIFFGLTTLIVCVDAQARIAFVSERVGNGEIYVMDTDGGNLRRLTNHPDWDIFPAWSPDGKQIAFMSDRDGHVDDRHGSPIYDIYVMDTNGTNQHNLTNDPHDDRHPSWSPDGKRIVFETDRDREGNPHNIEIYVMDADGTNQRKLTNNLTEDRYPAWSPDGERIAFSARREVHVVHNLDITYEIYVMDADGMNQQRLTENRKNERYPSWSPDGKRIAFSADRKGDLQNFDIYVMDADGGNEQKLTENRVHDRYPSWSPDGNRIVFASEKDGNWESLDIYVMDADGGNLQNLTNNPRIDLSPAWLNSPFSVSPAGKKFTVWGSLKQRER